MAHFAILGADFEKRRRKLWAGVDRTLLMLIPSTSAVASSWQCQSISASLALSRSVPNRAYLNTVRNCAEVISKPRWATIPDDGFDRE
jgi:hypothetical protein